MEKYSFTAKNGKLLDFVTALNKFKMYTRQLRKSVNLTMSREQRIRMFNELYNAFDKHYHDDIVMMCYTQATSPRRKYPAFAQYQYCMMLLTQIIDYEYVGDRRKNKRKQYENSYDTYSQEKRINDMKSYKSVEQAENESEIDKNKQYSKMTFGIQLRQKSGDMVRKFNHGVDITRLPKYSIELIKYILNNWNRLQEERFYKKKHNYEIADMMLDVLYALNRCGLTKTQRKYINLLMEGYTESQIAKKCNKPRQSVNKSLHRAFNAVFSFLEPDSKKIYKMDNGNEHNPLTIHNVI